MHIAGRGQQNGIAVDDASLGITEQSPVRISVERHSQIELAARFGNLLAQRFRMQRPALFVDVLTVGRNVDKCRLNTEGSK